MAYTCFRCSKGKQRGHKVSHAKNRSKRVFKPNLHKFRVMTAAGIRKKMMLCSKCIRIVRSNEVKMKKAVEKKKKVKVTDKKKVKGKGKK